MSVRFRLSASAIDSNAERLALGPQAAAGAFVSFEGWVRNHHGGREVLRLQYEAHATLAQRSGEQILAELTALHGLHAAACVHRVGMLEIGEVAVWVGVCAAHRDAAFAACRQIIDRIKAEVPIWKHEHYTNNEKTWVGADVVKPT
jgi:molybdopterin synthase catalytic subunit